MVRCNSPCCLWSRRFHRLTVFAVTPVVSDLPETAKLEPQVMASNSNDGNVTRSSNFIKGGQACDLNVEKGSGASVSTSDRIKLLEAVVRQD